AFGFFLILFADGMGVPLHAETGEEIDALNIDALILQDFYGQQGIQSTGDQCYSFTLHQVMEVTGMAVGS
ncbi:hypothetical protein, partial [Thiolapillus sp.]